MTRHNHKRGGLTLLELLVVLGILTLLAALVMSGVAAVRDRQMVNSTASTLDKLQKAIDTQVQGLVDQAAKDRSTRTPAFTNFVSFCGGDEDRAQALLTYCKIKQAFPQNFSEVTTATGFTVNGVPFPRHTAYKKFDGVPVAAGSPEEQSAALLYAGLSGMGTGGALFASDDGTSGNTTEWPFGNTSATVYMDSWKRPICFARFHENVGVLNVAPYANVKPNSPSLDPFDPLGKLGGTASNTWANKAAALTQLGIGFNMNNKVITPYSWGADKKSNALDVNSDDILGYKLRQLGSNATGKKQ